MNLYVLNTDCIKGNEDYIHIDLNKIIELKIKKVFLRNLYVVVAMFVNSYKRVIYKGDYDSCCAFLKGLRKKK